MSETYSNVPLTPQEYIEKYSNILIEDFNFNDIKIEFHGLIGYLINLFGWTQFDIQSYFNYLFKEGFLSSAEENRNLYIHGLKYGYEPDFAKAALASGTMTFDFSTFAQRSQNTDRREILLNDNNQIRIRVSDYIFTSNVTYRFVEKMDAGRPTYYCVLSSPSESQKIVSSPTGRITVPLVGFYQRVLEKKEYLVHHYEYGTHHQKILNLQESQEGSYINEIKALVKLYKKNEREQYRITRIKAFEDLLSKVLFVTKISDKSILIETGSGYYGNWIPNSNIYLDVWITRGRMANHLTQQTGILYNYNPTIIKYDSAGNVISSSNIDNDYIKINLSHCSGGSDPLTDNELKKDIIKWIQSRDNLMSRQDFYNIFSKFLKDFNILLKKGHMVDNNFYLYRTIRDYQQNVLLTNNVTYQCIQYDNENLFENIRIYTEELLSSDIQPNRTYYYKIMAVDKFYQSIPSNDIVIHIAETGREIILKWDRVPNAEYYIVFGRDSHTNTRYTGSWIIDEPAISTEPDTFYFTDTGGSMPNLAAVLDIKVSNVHKPLRQVNNPSFNINIEINKPLSFCDYEDYYGDHPNLPDKLYYINLSDELILNNLSHITYNDDNLYYVHNSSKDQLIENSFLISDNVIFFKFDDDFSIKESIVNLYYNKQIELNSPFIYKYNEFFNWFEGYFIYDNIIKYPIITESAEDFQTTFFYHIQYDYNTNLTSINIKSHQDISDYNFKLKIPGIHQDYILPDVTGRTFTLQNHQFIDKESEILLEIRDNVNTFQARSTTAFFKQSYKIEDQLSLLTYKSEDNNNYIVNIPSIQNIQEYDFETKDYIKSQIYEFMINSNISQTRMLSDSIQTRFLNTVYLHKYYHDRLLKSGYVSYNNHIVLPLKIKILVKYNSDYSYDSNSEYNKIILEVAKELQMKHTGININFHNSMIIDLIHSLNDKIDSVKVFIYDSVDTYIDGLETIKERDFIYTLKDKLKIQEYTTMYWWWDIDGIDLVIS